MSEWKETQLSELIEIIGGGTPSTKKPEYWKGQIPWLSVIDFSTVQRWVETTEKTITEKGLKNSSTKMLNVGDLIISARGTVGELAQLKIPMAFNQSCYGIRATNATSNDYVYYLIKFNINKLKKNTHGSVFNTITIETFNQINIKYPISKTEQNQTVNVLAGFDKKIDLLRCQNETLEAIAQTLFKRWFVEFEFPNKEGRPYKSSGGKMVPSELGEIPEGWKVGLSGDIILLQGGFAFKSKDFKKVGKHAIIKIKNIQNQIVDILNTDFVDDAIVQNLDEKFRIKPGNVLIAMTGAEVAKMGIVPQNDSNLWLNQRVGLFKNKINNAVLFIYYLFSKPEYQKALRDKGTGSSAQPNISATDIESIRILVPDINVLNDFAILANPMFNKVISNLRQIQLLAKTCDTLLPKLMSGQIRVK
jgi:type I restriction enzyme S subunit